MSFRPKRITQAQASRELSKRAKTVLIDVRSPVAFRDGTLPHAVNVVPSKASLLIKYPVTTKLILFGASDGDPDIGSVANYAFQLGFVEIYALGAKENWQ